MIHLQPLKTANAANAPRYPVQWGEVIIYGWQPYEDYHSRQDNIVLLYQHGLISRALVVESLMGVE